MNRPTARLYLVTPPAFDPEPFAVSLDDALRGGRVALLQLRLKKSDGSPESPSIIARTAAILMPVANARNVPFLLNDDPDMAAALGCDGVHVGPSDLRCALVRERIGPRRIIGVSCRNSHRRAVTACAEGADYVSFGAFRPSTTKRVHHRATPSLLTAWRAAADVPCVAIGGITPSDAPALLRAGADLLACSAYVWRHPHGPATAIADFHAACETADTAAGNDDPAATDP